MLRVLGLTLAVFAVVCAARAGTAPADERITAVRPEAGELTVLSYNVAGLPQLISHSDPEANIPVIGKLLNHYDVALVQEDFVYHSELSARARHAYRSAPRLLSGLGISDGLNRFSSIPFTAHGRVAWARCYGYLGNGCDCLAEKGFSYAEHRLDDQRLLIYNIHLDSGQTTRDIAVRSEQIDQLLSHLERHAAGSAVIVAGDTNFDSPGDERALERFLAGAELRDACRDLGCDGPELIDRIMYRSSPSLDLKASRYTLDRRFTRNDGDDLSDHKAVGVVFSYSTGAPDHDGQRRIRASHVTTDDVAGAALRRHGHTGARSVPDGHSRVLRNDPRRASAPEAPHRVD